MTVTRREIGDLLVDNGVITPEELELVRVERASTGDSITAVLQRLGLAGENQLKNALELEFGVNYVALKKYSVDHQLVRLVPDTVIKEHMVVPLLQEGSRIIVAMVDPSDNRAAEAIRSCLQEMQIKTVVCLEDDFYQFLSGVVEGLDDGIPEGESLSGNLAELKAEPAENGSRKNKEQPAAKVNFEETAAQPRLDSDILAALQAKAQSATADLTDVTPVAKSPNEKKPASSPVSSSPAKTNDKSAANSAVPPKAVDASRPKSSATKPADAVPPPAAGVGKDEPQPHVSAPVVADESRAHVSTSVVADEPQPHVSAPVVPDESRAHVSAPVVPDESRAHVSTPVVADESPAHVSTPVVADESPAHVSTPVVADEPQAEATAQAKPSEPPLEPPKMTASRAETIEHELLDYTDFEGRAARQLASEAEKETKLAADRMKASPEPEDAIDQLEDSVIAELYEPSLTESMNSTDVLELALAEESPLEESLPEDLHPELDPRPIEAVEIDQPVAASQPSGDAIQASEEDTGSFPTVTEEEAGQAMKEEAQQKAGAALSEMELAKRAQEEAIVLLANQILGGAIKRHCSNVHIVPSHRQAVVQYRLNGVLYVDRKLPATILTALVARYKMMARLDLAVHDLPQDGHIKVKSSSKEIVCLISTVPAADGEHVVIWIV